MFRKILVYGLPLYLYALEALIRTIGAIHTETVLGPTLAGAGIGFLLEATDLKPMKLSPDVVAALGKLDAKVYSEREKRLVDFIWLAFCLSLGAWMYSLFCTFHPEAGPVAYASLFIGCGVFFVSIVLSAVKENVNA
ncbi:hypothetical protein [Paraburkholderia sp. J8-2]|uniref:hypothetical protein n=1 Tax=Paraburkholderia sp. J8-2 TaxID=2805440 RepID=UPI002AB7B3A9|nr:hypothetical protein [Paraburkholderia sp. J8-2]